MTRTLRLALPIAALTLAAALQAQPDGDAAALQQAAATELGCEVQRTIGLPGDITLTLVLVPAGEYTMGAADGESSLDPDETPRTPIRIPRPLWVGRCEVTNQQFHAFRPEHDSRYADTSFKDRVGPGYPLNTDAQPVCRVSWDDAVAFCAWLSEVSGLSFRLPSEAEWEYACRAGTTTRFWCPDTDLPRCANFADASLGALKPWALRDRDRSDGQPVSAAVGSYQPNPWGLCDMHGNVAEWTSSVYLPYPFDAARAIAPASREDRVIRGGSWDDRPRRVRSAFRLAYPPDQIIYNVGFRVFADATPQ